MIGSSGVDVCTTTTSALCSQPSNEATTHDMSAADRHAWSLRASRMTLGRLQRGEALLERARAEALGMRFEEGLDRGALFGVPSERTQRANAGLFGFRSQRAAGPCQVALGVRERRARLTEVLEL